MYLLISLFVIAGLALTGCQKATEEPVVEEPEVEEPEVEEPEVEEPEVEEPEVEEPEVEEPEEAALGTEENPLIWALVPSGETEDVLAGFDSVTDIIYEETGLVIESFVATEYVGVIEALAADPPKAHIASLATFAYLVAAERGVAEAELVAVRYGAPYYTGQIFVRTDSGITDISELSGSSFCRPDEYSTSGWIIPSITLRSVGIDPDADLDIVDAGSHDASVIGVYNGDCVAGSSFVDARSSVSDEYPDVMEVLTVINESVEIPNDGVQYHPIVSREIRDLINGVMLRIDEIEGAVEALEQAYEWTELAAFGDDFYDPFRNVLSAAGVNIEDYLGE
jgi:phosphonate transport system substrate-binding protein